ncbi:MAG: sodium:proton antiporter [Gammaproteobacteria bacterium]|nr:sodium:proton antiporter [Gammaproteobacteria bacterium]MCD8524923.1 sodium:proton antiporter [Gammaproteobacteria bacterium]MCD8542378.1 sodium:proton antiporter [Gammaproteobacteria bacterium]
MNIFNILAFLFTTAVAFSYINYRYIKLQNSIAITLMTACITLLIVILHGFGLNLGEEHIAQALEKINFHSLLMNGMLSFLLFAGALNFNIDQLLSEKWEIVALALCGTVISTGIVGVMTFYFLMLVHHPLELTYCLMFGALISPTDPIAVLAIFKKLKAPVSLETRLAGESLFNDGVGIVLFVTIYAITYEHHAATIAAVSLLFLQQAIGGILYGVALGYLGYRLIKPLDDSLMEILITLAIATGGYAVAQIIDISGPLAMVVAGIFLGNRKKMFYMTEKSRQHLIHFWEVIDHAFNAILFLLIGLELITIQRSMLDLVCGVGAIVIVLIARCFSVTLPLCFLSRKQSMNYRIMIWGGLRGGLAIALALTLPSGVAKTLIVPMTYAVVLFSILVQGLSISRLLRHNWE